MKHVHIVFASNTVTDDATANERVVGDPSVGSVWTRTITKHDRERVHPSVARWYNVGDGDQQLQPHNHRHWRDVQQYGRQVVGVRERWHCNHAQSDTALQWVEQASTVESV